MPWVHFLKRHDWRVHPRQVVVFPKDGVYFVTRACAAEAVAAGAAELCERPKREAESDEGRATA